MDDGYCAHCRQCTMPPLNQLTDATLSGKESVTHFNGICPFCCENDFDLAGLKRHLTVGDCAEWNEIENLNPKLF